MNNVFNHHSFHATTNQSKQTQTHLLATLLLLVLLLAVGTLAGSVLAASAGGPGGTDTAVMQISTIQVTAIATPFGTVTPVPLRTDLGDAPDSTNHFGVPMTAYPNVVAQFPTVFDPTTGLPVGPRHRNLSLPYHLGPAITYEREADTGPDADGINNIVPPTDSKNNDGADDGLNLPVSLPHCQTTTLTYNVTVLANGPTQAYFNAWVDFNRNGAWGDVLNCPFSVAQEWAVQNQLVNFPGPGTYIITTPPFLSYNNTPTKRMWLRISLSDSQAPAADGRGINGGYLFGETEDYKVVGGGIIVTSTAQATPIEPGEH